LKIHFQNKNNALNSFFHEFHALIILESVSKDLNLMLNGIEFTSLEKKNKFFVIALGDKLLTAIGQNGPGER
jgi:hypothetical protein